MGLDQDDVIVRRRLGQKLEFLLEDVSALRDPTTAELEGLVSSSTHRNSRCRAVLPSAMSTFPPTLGAGKRALLLHRPWRH